MTETADWQPTFDAAQKVPGSKHQQPAKKTYEELRREAELTRTRYASDIAVSMGAVDTGEDFDPYSAIYEQHNTGGFATTNLAREQAQIAAAVGQLQADVTANNNSGKSLIVTVGEYGTSIPSVFDLIHESGSGTVVNDGNTLEFSNNNGRKLYGYNAEPLATNHFEVSLGVPRQAGDYFGSYGDRALYFIGRGDATWDNYCLARLNGNRLRIGAVIDGVSTIDAPTWFGSGNGSGPTEVTISPRSYMTFAGGTIADEKVFQFKVHNQVVATFTDSGDLSLIGDDFRWAACGLQNSVNDFVNRAPNISHFMANDNEPAPVVGSIGHMFRVSTGQVSVSAGVHSLGTSFFDQVGELSPDLTYDLTTGTFTVTESDTYTIAASSRTGTSWVNNFAWVLHVNGLPYRYFPMPEVMWGSNALGGTIKPNLVGATLPVYLNAGDVVNLGYDVDGTAGNILRGDAAGLMTYFTITRGAK